MSDKITPIEQVQINNAELQETFIRVKEDPVNLNNVMSHIALLSSQVALLTELIVEIKNEQKNTE